MLTTPRGPYRWACSTCKKGKQKCSPHQDTDKCERCARLGKECTRPPSGRGKNPQNINALAVEASSPAHTSSHGTSGRNSVVPVNQNLPPPPRQGTNPLLNLLSLVSSRRGITVREVHDSALDRGIEWATENFGGFDARAFRTDCFAAIHVDRYYPVRACHWALLLRQFCSDRMLSKDEAEMFVSDVLWAWSDDLRFGTRWTLDAISILLKHLRETGDIRSHVVEALEEQMVLVAAGGANHISIEGQNSEARAPQSCVRLPSHPTEHLDSEREFGGDISSLIFHMTDMSPF